MRPPRPLPTHLVGRAFTTDDVGLHGQSIGRLRGRDLSAPHRGVRTVGVDLDTVRGRCRAYEPLLGRSRVFSHVTAALLLDLPLPPRVASAPELHVGARDGTTPPRARGIVGHRLAPDTVVAFAHGHPVTAALDTWRSLADVLPQEELVAVGDRIVSGVRTGTDRTDVLASVADLRQAALEHRGRRGAAALRWAAARVRTGVDSRPESLLRLAVVEAGLPEPLVGHPVVVDHGGLTLHPDLADTRARLLYEYEGDFHRTERHRFRDDIHRRELLEDAGWRVIRVTADDLFARRQQFIRRIRHLHAARAQ
ncbi:hypothetical protein [Plantibacter sp. M259]|uniref:hypothetical protein n=1 Tax=Plantibacter sp. M259 TaxID=2583822 RepID=UPI00111038D8|nr:hypothetical protein [Plantibacter sp. M259]